MIDADMLMHVASLPILNSCDGKDGMCSKDVDVGLCREIKELFLSLVEEHFRLHLV
jgi:hypothetical protein